MGKIKIIINIYIYNIYNTNNYNVDDIFNYYKY